MLAQSQQPTGPAALRVILMLLLFILGMYYWVVSFTVSHRGILKLLV